MTDEEKRSARAAYMRSYYAKNRERIREQERIRRAAHPEKRREYQRAYAKAHPEVQRRWHKQHPEYMEGWRAEHREQLRLQRHERTARSYGLTVEAVRRLQGGRCDLCGQPERVPRVKRLGIDHDHITGRIRGFLCVSCNISLGYYERGCLNTKFHRLGITERVNRYLKRWL